MAATRKTESYSSVLKEIKEFSTCDLEKLATIFSKLFTLSFLELKQLAFCPNNCAMEALTAKLIFKSLLGNIKEFELLVSICLEQVEN